MKQTLLLRVFVGEDDRLDGAPLYDAIVNQLRRRGIGGATVLKGIEGFGGRRTVHSARALEYSLNLPVVIEVFEQQERIEQILPMLHEMISSGLLTLERADVQPVSRT